MAWTQTDDEQKLMDAEAFASRWMLDRFGTDKLNRDMTPHEAAEMCVAFVNENGRD